MLEALGVYTSKSFSLFETGEMLFRGDEPSPTRSSVLVRLGHSHVRFGTFQRYAFLGDVAALGRLLGYAVERHFPRLAGAADTPVAFFRAVIRRSAHLAASWMMAGFVHGVLNTDNMNVTGESFDYGPYRFLPTYDPEFTAAYFDHHGLYAFGHQPAIVEWNLAQLAIALSHLGSRAGLEAALQTFGPTYEAALVARFLARLGVTSRGPDEDAALGTAVFRFLAESQVGYEQFFFDWYGGAVSAPRALAGLAAERYAGTSFEAVRRRLDAYGPGAPERLAHPYWQRLRPCTLLIDEIETLWDAIAGRDDWSLFDAKIAAIAELRAVLGCEPTAGDD
jgi:uncharacterized protein YdiU (UPF0061 family)